MEIEIKEQENTGFVIAKKDEVTAGQMTYAIAGKDFIIIDHTEINPEFKNRGIGKQLLYKVVDMAREKNIKIIPLCPFANIMFRKFEDIRDVLRT